MMEYHSPYWLSPLFHRLNSSHPRLATWFTVPSSKRYLRATWNRMSVIKKVVNLSRTLINDHFVHNVTLAVVRERLGLPQKYGQWIRD
jgi:hypothetical protein